MKYTVTAGECKKINIAPESVVEEVLQNISMILETVKNTVPLNRDFGLSSRFLDMPTPAAEAVLVSELYDAIEEYEPRAEIVNITFEKDELTGKELPRLEVEIKNE